jgi:hypothetical protein
MNSANFKRSSTGNLIDAIGALLTDRALRNLFSLDPRQAAEQLGLMGAECEFVVRLDIASLEAQAETLFQKRWHEVSQILPMTIAMLESDAEPLFRYVASKSWPKGHRRHWRDASHFIVFVERNGLGQADAAEKRQVAGRVA